MPEPGISRATLSDAATIIVGLGNPGPKYANTRHNVGWRVLDLVSQQLQVPVNERRPKAVLGTGYHGGKRVVLAKPRTFMNNSGEAVEYLLARFGGNGTNLLVIYDEMALLPGRIRLRAAGSDAGHNGIRSIIQAVGGTGFPRLRVGIGGPPPGVVAREYVLEWFTDDEAEPMSSAVERAAAAVQCLLADGIDAAMNRYNQDPSTTPPMPPTENDGPHRATAGHEIEVNDLPARTEHSEQQISGSDQNGQ